MDHDIQGSVAHGSAHERQELIQQRQALPAPQCLTEPPVKQGEDNVLWGVRVASPRWVRDVIGDIDDEAYLFFAHDIQAVCANPTSLENAAVVVFWKRDDAGHGHVGGF